MSEICHYCGILKRSYMSLASTPRPTPRPIGGRYMTDKEVTKIIERLRREYTQRASLGQFMSIDHLRSALDIIVHLQNQLYEAHELLRVQRRQP